MTGKANQMRLPAAATTATVRTTVVAISMLLVGACTSKHGATPPRSGSPSVKGNPSTFGASPSDSGPGTPSATPDQSSAPPPAGAGTPGASEVTGAEAALRNYVATVNAAASSGDAFVLKNLAATSCAVCQQYLGTIESLAAQHQKLRGGTISVSAIKAASGGTSQSVTFQAKTSTAAGSVVTDAGKVISSFRATPVVTYTFRLDQRDGKWIVVSGARAG